MRARDYVVRAISEALSPITHARKNSGNVSLISTEHVPTERGNVEVPVISGNAIRHRAVRSVGARWLVEEYGLAGRLTLPQLNFLFHGGAITEGGGREDTRLIAEAHRLWPFVGLLGGCTPRQIIPGALHVHRGILVCEENRRTIAKDVPGALDGIGRLRPASSMLSEYQYTRSDAALTAADIRGEGDEWRVAGRGDESYRAILAALMPEGAPCRLADYRAPNDKGNWSVRTTLMPRSDAEAAARAASASVVESDTQLMIFGGHAVIRGSLWSHGFVLPHVSEAELGCLLWSIRLWKSAGATVGGHAAKGHGRLDTSLLAGDWDADAAVEAYLDRARAHRDEAVAWLDAAFDVRRDGPAPAPAPKARGKKKADAAEAA